MIDRDVTQAYGYLMFNAGLLRNSDIFAAGILHSAAEHLINPLRECCKTVEMYLGSKSYPYGHASESSCRPHGR